MFFVCIAALSVRSCLALRHAETFTHNRVYDDPVQAATCVDVRVSSGLGFLPMGHPDRVSFETAHTFCKKAEEEGGVGTVAVVSADFSFHRESLTGRAQKASKPIWFLHTSKNAGTFFCSCANQFLNIGLPHNGGINCHFLDEDRPMWGHQNVSSYALFSTSDPHTSHCAMMSAEFEQRGIDVEGDENVLPTGADTYFCPGMRTVAFLRNPITRFFSMLQQMRVSEEKMLLLTPRIMNETWPTLTNNFVVRSLLGFHMFEMPLLALRDEDMERAKARLSSFDYIFFVDAHLSHNLDVRLGWTCDHVEGRHSSAEGGTQGLANRMREALGGSYNELSMMMGLDQQLLDHGRVLNFIRGDTS
uniref:Sulfotransferase domain-containing protein n=1 Tax=Noctiluca scintillans TaxID=2966 RepID=A0A7S1F1B9_NOCSC|mmetsp:Transcript_24276/g.63666  ORF Transcript_24276/g.63666 Transcript_24276/m.63666 type:complete len:360 (+) Transcript_24276:38-1117(+)